MSTADDRSADTRRLDPWAPDEVFQSILRYSVVPTFDLVLDGIDGVLLVRRIISPYDGLWALPGLRIFKGETIYECLSRIALHEVGIRVEPVNAKFVNQAVAKFDTHQERQDLSTCYAFKLETDHINLNSDHLSGLTFVKDLANAPSDIGDLYVGHLRCYFEMKGNGEF